MRKAFTLIEVNLAMLVMAGGVLSIVGLYAFGFRESKQSKEDVVSAVVAESVLSEYAAGLSKTNMTWSTFNSIPELSPGGGWIDYIDDDGRARETTPPTVASVGFPSGILPNGYMAGVVVSRSEDSSVVDIAVRVGKKNSDLMAMPLYFTSVRFQGTSK